MKLPFDFGIKLIFRLVFPGVILAAALVPAVHGLLNALGVLIKFEYLFPVEVIGWGWAMVLGDMQIYMLFEGRRYWPVWLRGCLLASEQRRLDRLSKIMLAPPTPPADRRSYLEAGVEYLHFPFKENGEAYVEHPTRLGNIIESYESYPKLKYGLDSVVYWFRLWVVLDKDLREEIDTAQALVDSAVYVTFAFYVSGLVMLAYAVVEATVQYGTPHAHWLAAILLPHVPKSWGLLCFMSAACVTVAFIIYRLSLAAHAQFGEMFKAIFDRYGSRLVFDGILDEVSRISGGPTLTTRSPKDKYQIIARYLRWHLVRDEASGKNLSIEQWNDRRKSPPPGSGSPAPPTVDDGSGP